MQITEQQQALIKKFCHRSEWRWDHAFPRDIGEEGRWEICLYSIENLTEDGYAGYVAMAPLENGEWIVIFTLDGEEERFVLTKPSLAEAKAALDRLLAANTPQLPADRDAADPWFGNEALHRQILEGMLSSDEFVQGVRDEVNVILKDWPPGPSPFDF